MTYNNRNKQQKRAKQFLKKPFEIMLFVIVLLILAGSGFAHRRNDADAVYGNYLDNTNIFAVMNSAIGGIGNMPPVANNDAAITSKDMPVNINVIANDTDPDGTIDPATVVIASNPSNGTAVPNSDGTVTYTPDTGFVGADSFTYTVQDNEGAISNEATVTVTVVSGTHVFTAYNDLSWSAGQADTRVTLYTTGQSGLLKDYFSGTNTAATLTIAGGYIDSNNTPVQGSNANIGTDAYAVFNGIVDSVGLISYSTTNLTFTFTGLDPDLNYEFVLFGNRNNTSYTNRMTTTTISDIMSFTNASTPGATFSGATDPSVTIVNGYNTINGYVARFININPGADGDMLITVSSPTGQFYANALMLRATRTSGTTPPEVIGTSPANGTTGVGVNSVITATFSETMDAGSITTSTFLVNDGISNIGGTVTYSGTTATFTPSGPLAHFTKYTATITTGVRGVEGNAMPADYVWSFTTAADGVMSGLQAYYKFDEGAGTSAADASGNGNNGTLFNGPVWTTGKINSALSFDGVNDYVEVPNSTSLNPVNFVTVSAWIYPTAPGQSNDSKIIAKRHQTLANDNYSLGFISESRPEARIVIGGSMKSIYGPVLSLNAWHHLVGVYDGSTLKLYVNGTEVNSVAASGSLDTSTHPLRIGTRAVDPVNRYFKGSIDEVYVFNRALSDQEVLSLFNPTASPDTTPPEVISTNPVSGATGVGVNSVITATFSEAMDAGSITTSTFLVNDGISNIGGTVTYSDTTATFAPSAPLTHSTTYTATITTGVRDLAGNAMMADYTWGFTTAADGVMSGLQAYYKFDEGTGTVATDSSGNNRNGAIHGATWTTGKIGGALSFDGDDYVTIPRMNYDEISVSAWFNKSSSGNHVIFGGYKSNADVQLQEGFDLLFNSATPDRLRFIVATRNASGTRTVKTAIRDFANSNGSWYHVVGTYNKATGEQKLYIDGQLVNTQTHPPGNVIVPLTDRHYMAIGTRYATWGFFRGSIDEVYIFNRALSDQEVLSLFNPTASPDTTPPEVIGTSPADGATGVGVNSVITATFSEAMDAGSITTSTFLVNDGISNIGGTVSYSGTTATFTPSGPLAHSTTYTATITTGVRDVEGNAMVANYTWSFTTTAMVDTTPPEVIGTSPVDGATGVGVNSVIMATFSEAMDAGSITTSTFLVNDGISNIGGTVSYSGTTATFTPSGPLAHSTTYTATITTGVRDVEGNAMVANYTWSFTTTAMVDTTPPEVIGTSPVDGATGVGVNSVIMATFSEAMDAGSITTSTFLVNDGISNIGGTVTYSDTTATFAPSAPLTHSTTYTATITTGVRDLAGNAMMADYTWGFTTAADGVMSGLQAYYKFDEGTGTVATDSSGNNRNGTIHGATWTTGKIGGALSFNGTSNYVSVPPLNYDEISVSAWFYRNSVDTATPDTVFGGWSWSRVEGYGLYFNQYSGSRDTIRFIVTTQTSGGTKTQKHAIMNLGTSTGKWFHVTGTYSKTTGEQKLYVDGQLVNTQTHPAGNTIVPYTAASYMAIGALLSNYGHMDGIVDEVQVYNRALSDQEVLTLFNNQ
ncbi:MAG: Ig-like domain-containing protein [Candidatus Brocadiaceae baterium WH-1]|nr:MAG: Ig-like domain-containing protein [Candidatus Jettenia sp. AMX2]